MKNITLSADPSLIEQARAIARSRNRTLNDEFRDWLAGYTAQSGAAPAFHSLMARLKHVKPGRTFTREEMNER
jgi:hypothetical protein